LLVAAFFSPGIIRKLETELIGFGPTAWVFYANGNDNNTIDVEFIARGDSRLRNARSVRISDLDAQSGDSNSIPVLPLVQAWIGSHKVAPALCQWRRQIVPNSGEKVYRSG
jgi:hypothetical protein